MKKLLLTLALTSLFITGARAADDRLVLVGASYGKNVLAICEADGTVLWQHDTAGPAKGHTGHHDVHLLPGGNILFHDTLTKTQEITLGKEVVWGFDELDLVGNGLACWQVLDAEQSAMLRERLAALKK